MSNPIVVYDLYYPSPVPLKEIVLNKIVIELWRQEIHKHRSKGTLEQLDFEKSISSSILRPFVPSSFLDTIDKKISQVGTSIKRWVWCYTANQIFQSHALHEFDDFVCDFDGSIHYGKTAKRILLCDEISQIAKFKIACLCCFEEDIKLLWPSVSSRFNLKDIDVRKNFSLFYWVCRLRNQLYKIPVSSEGDLYVSVFSNIIVGCSHWSSVEYFFNRFDSSTRINLTKMILYNLPREFYRYVVPKLNEEELDEILTTNRFKFWYSSEVLKIWMYVRHKVTANDFANLIRQIMKDPDIYENFHEIWISAPDDFKQLALQRVLLNNDVLDFFAWSSYKINFLSIAFSDVSFQDRRKFWDDNWIEFLFIMNTNDVRQLMAICFENENEIIEYKKNVMANYEKIRTYLCSSLANSRFEALNNILNFCFVGEQNIRSIRLRLLNEDFNIHHLCLEEADLFNKFINDAYNDIDGVTEFKNQWLSRPRTVERFKGFICEGSLRLVREFIEKLMPSETATKEFKKNVLLPTFKSCLTNGSYLMIRGNVDYQNFLPWCLENDEIDKFKQMLSADETVHAVIRREMQRIRENNPPMYSDGRDPMTYHPKLIEFLKWNFVTIEAYENFVAKYADDEDFIKLITRIEQNVA